MTAQPNNFAEGHGSVTHLVPHPGARALSDEAADLLFREAHTTYRFTDEPVAESQIRAAYELMKWAPTSMNSQPMRLTVVTSDAARERLIQRLGEGNRAKSESAPMMVVLSYDVDFHDHLPEVAPHLPSARDGFLDESQRHVFGSFNAALQAAYFILAIRATGLAAGPMGGFDRAGVDADLFPGRKQRSFLVVNVGYPAPDGQFPRSPRLAYDAVVSVV